MAVVLQCMFIIILSVEMIMGNLGNVFMVLVNIMDWVKSRKISSVDQILTALAISRLALLWALVMNFLLFLLYPGLMMNGKIVYIITIFWVVTNHFSIWFATSLSFFYFLKIASFSHSIFLYLKWRVKKVVSVTLLVSLPILSFNIMCIGVHICVWFDEHKTNMSYPVSSNNMVQLSKPILSINSTFTFIPFIPSLMTFLLLIFSLWKHHKKMKQSTHGGRDTSTMAHIRALQNVITFLLLYSIFLLSLLLQFWYFDFMYKIPTILVLWSTGLAFPSVHSCVLILKSTKLRQSFLLALRWLRCKSKGREFSSP